MRNEHASLNKEEKRIGVVFAEDHLTQGTAATDFRALKPEEFPSGHRDHREEKKRKR